MRTEAYISLSRTDILDKDWDHLRRIVPEAFVHGYLRGTFNVDDPQLNKLLAYLRKIDMKPWADRSKRKEKHEFLYQLSRFYNLAGLQSYEYFQLNVQKRFENTVNGDNDQQLNYDELLRMHKASILGDPSNFACYVSDGIRKRIEALKVIGPEFKGKSVWEDRKYTENGPREPRRMSWSDIPNGPWWQLISGILLAPVSNRMHLEDCLGKRLEPGDQGGCVIREGFYTDPELHYARSVAKKFPAFDVAFTREYWTGTGKDDYRRLIVSKHFFELSVKEKFKLDFRPVHIDEDL